MKTKKHSTIDPDNPPLTKEQLRSMRRVTPEEVEEARKAIEKKLGIPRPPRWGRPPKPAKEKYTPVHLRLHPKALAWVKAEAKRRGLGYQTLINQLLLEKAA